MKLTKSNLRNIIKEEIEATLDEARLGVQRAARDIAERFGGDFDRQVGGVSVGGGRKMSTIKYFAVFDETEQRNEAWDILLDEGEDIGQMGATRHPIILWNGVKLYRLPFHGPGYIGAGIGVASKGKIDNIPEGRDESSKELRDFEGFGKDDEIAYAIEDLNDALYMLGEEEDASGTLFHVINRLEEVKSRLQELAPGLTQHI